jgi:hypothetical protein
MKSILHRLSAILVLTALGCARLHAWPAVVFNPTNGVIMIPTNFVAANLSSAQATNNFSGTVTNIASSIITGGSYSNVVVLQQGLPFDGVYANPGTSLYANASGDFYSVGTNWAVGSFSYGQAYYLVGQGIVLSATNWYFFSYYKFNSLTFPSITIYSSNTNQTATPPTTGWSAYGSLTPNPTYFPSSVYLTTLTQHFNLTTFTNGVCSTNILQ